MGRPASASAWAGGLGPGALAAAFVALTAWSWGKWTDVHIDFGVELYVPWQLHEGKALYRDIASRNGPLSHHLNALWFALGGVSIRTLVVANLAILAGICALTWRVFADACGRATATAAVFVLLAVFGFSQYVAIANFNYVTPYQHAQTHGVALSIALIVALVRGLSGGSAGWCAAAGACLGGVLLTKAELAAPALVTALAGWLLVPTPGRRAGPAAAFAAGAALPPAAFLAYLGARMPAPEALAGVLGNWRFLGAGLLSDRFYLEGAGLDDAASHLATALRMFAGLAAFAGLARAADRVLPARSARSRALWSLALAAALFAWLTLDRQRVPWVRLARALPLVAATGALALAIACRRARGDRERLRRLAPLALWAIWSLPLLGKMLLNARLGHYGFTLAMPASLLLVAGLLELPRLARPGGGPLGRALAAAAIAAGVVFYLQRSEAIYQRRVVSVGSGADRILVDPPRGPLVERALQVLAQRAPPDATLLVLPEGISLNYWLRRESPSRYPLFLPTELAAFGAERMLADVRAHPPDFVALVHRRHDEFGVGPFGVDPRNGRALVSWVREHYRRFALLGAEPFGERFGIALLERRGGASP